LTVASVNFTANVAFSTEVINIDIFWVAFNFFVFADTPVTMHLFFRIAHQLLHDKSPTFHVVYKPFISGYMLHTVILVLEDLLVLMADF
jgi:hypothetical protein